MYDYDTGYRPSMSEHALSFGAVAERYDRYRPRYAEAAIVWATAERPLRVADLGAGTGILSRQLAELGHEVIAIEPDDQMRRRLVTASTGVTARTGSAEEIPLPDGSVDVVVAGQAYHWFDRERALPEIARVLRPGGVFAPMWNDADDVEWAVRYNEIIDGARDPGDRQSDEGFGAWFSSVEVGRFPHDVWMSPQDLIALATTRSPYLVASPQEQKRLLDSIHRLLKEYGLLSQDQIAMPHHTEVHRAVRVSH